jgi:hypothetical protein
MKDNPLGNAKQGETWPKKGTYTHCYSNFCFGLIEFSILIFLESGRIIGGYNHYDMRCSIKTSCPTQSSSSRHRQFSGGPAMNLNPAAVLNPVFNFLDALISNYGVYLYLMFVWLSLAVIFHQRP